MVDTAETVRPHCIFLKEKKKTENYTVSVLLLGQLCVAAGSIVCPHHLFKVSTDSGSCTTPE